jgi:hypothetical protein
MGDFSLTIAVEQPPAIVFAFIAEPTNMTHWYDAVDHVALTPRQTVGVGTTFEITRSLPGGRATNVVEIVEYQHSSTVLGASGPRPSIGCSIPSYRASRCSGRRRRREVRPSEGRMWRSILRR